MACIELINRPVYRAPTKGRCYLNARSAADAEARAILEKRYPREDAEYEQGMMYYPGFHWSNDKRLVLVQKRLTRMILRQFRARKPQP